MASGGEEKRKKERNRKEQNKTKKKRSGKVQTVWHLAEVLLWCCCT
jgi:hypothetical protein